MERVFKWLTQEGGDPKATVYTSWFSRVFNPNDFDGIDRLLSAYINFCAKLYITPSKASLTSYLKVDGKIDIKKYNIHTDTMESYDYRELSQLEEAARIITEIAHATYDTYIACDLTDREFKVDMYDFMSSRKSDRIQQIMMDAYPRLMDGSNITDVSSELRSQLADLDDVYDTDKISDVDLGGGEEEAEMHFLAKTGLPCIDGDIGGIYTRLIYTLNAQPAGGKTRLGEVHFAYPILTVAKKDVIIYSTELTAMQVKNILIAHHIVKVYQGRIKIPDSVMNKKSEMSQELLQIYESAKIDLFESGNYGNLIIRDKCIAETYKDECISLMRASGNVGLIMIDYMGLIRSEPKTKWDKHKEKYEIITDGYEDTRDILKAFDVAALCINQYNDDGINAAYAGKPIRSGHVQGGHIVQRHTDYDMNLTYTEEQKLANVRSFSVSKTRGTKGFSNVLLDTDLSVSIFRQEITT